MVSEARDMAGKERNMRIRSMAQSALFAALLCILSPIAIPVGLIPVTLSVFVVLLTGIVLPWKQAAMAALVYLLIGFMGLPVFSGGQAGLGVLAGATGGYLWCYLPMAALASKLSHSGRQNLGMAVLGALLALLLCYTTGTLQFALTTNCALAYAFRVCVLPFVGFDLLKVAAAVLLGMQIRRRLQAAGMLGQGIR